MSKREDKNSGGLFYTSKAIEYEVLAGYSSVNSIVTVKSAKSVEQFDGSSYNCASFDINFAKDGPFLIVVL